VNPIKNPRAGKRILAYGVWVSKIERNCMPAFHTPHPTRRRPRWYQRLMDWLWFGPLTRDLYAHSERRHPR